MTGQPPPDGKPIEVLLVEDDPGDTLMIREALEAHAPEATVASVGDGVDAMRYLRRQDEFVGSPRPDLEVLEEVKADRELCTIPVVVLTTSDAAQDIRRSYQLHANAYVTKPADFDQFTNVVAAIERFFGRVVQRPRLA